MSLSITTSLFHLSRQYGLQLVHTICRLFKLRIMPKIVWPKMVNLEPWLLIRSFILQKLYIFLSLQEQRTTEASSVLMLIARISLSNVSILYIYLLFDLPAPIRHLATLRTRIATNPCHYLASDLSIGFTDSRTVLSSVSFNTSYQFLFRSKFVMLNTTLSTWAS